MERFEINRKLKKKEVNYSQKLNNNSWVKFQGLKRNFHTFAQALRSHNNDQKLQKYSVMKLNRDTMNQKFTRKMNQQDRPFINGGDILGPDEEPDIIDEDDETIIPVHEDQMTFRLSTESDHMGLTEHPYATT